MRHEVIDRYSATAVDIAEAWPRPDAGIQMPIGLIQEPMPQRPTPAAPDLPVAVGRMIVGVYAGLMLTFAVTMARSTDSTFMIAISALYVAIFLAVPRIFFAVEGDKSKRPSFRQFMAKGIDTYTGHMSGTAVLAQMFAVPVFVTFAVAIVGCVGLVMLP